MVKIKQDLLKSDRYEIKCPNAMFPNFITVHNTANDALAANEIAYMKRNDNQISFHFAVDDKEIIQGIPTNRNAWHCGDGSETNSGNRNSIGIEICYSKSGGERYKKAEKLAIKLIAQLLKQYGWGVDRVKKHQDWNGKYCPHRILDERRWLSFIAEIAKELDVPKIATVKDDVKSHWAENSINKAKDKGIMNGYADGTFGPNDTLTRGQFVSVLDRLGLLE
ncbi:N-acetylmuramoyl-L-alanine amidase [Mangrovibacillus cuniculi]|nr:N-acetylmuramoyl-L-alanine amidase [Mangrovibacillus cuniculi]